MVNLKDFVIKWNNENPLDKKFREKYNIAFNSPEHRQTNQLDILFEYVEDKVFEEYKQTIEDRVKKESQYKEGKWIEEKQLTNEESQTLFDRIDISQINSEDSQIQIK